MVGILSWIGADVSEILEELKLRFSEKATKFEKISHLFWYLLNSDKASKSFFQIFMAFSGDFFHVKSTCLDSKITIKELVFGALRNFMS